MRRKGRGEVRGWEKGPGRAWWRTKMTRSRDTGGQHCTRPGQGWREMSVGRPAERRDAGPPVGPRGFTLSTVGGLGDPSEVNFNYFITTELR